MDRGEIFRAHSFERARAQNRIEHRLTRPHHPWTNGEVERTNRTVKEVTAQRYHDARHDELRSHLTLFLDACSDAPRLKTLKGLTPFAFIRRSWAAGPHRFTANPHHEMPEPDIQSRCREPSRSTTDQGA